MSEIIQNAWYRIPGYNGYDYCFGLDEIRSWKVNVRFGGKILKKHTIDTWILTNDYNERVFVSRSEIHSKILNNPLQYGGSPNLSPRRHLSKDPKQKQTINTRDYDILEEKSIIPNFDVFIRKE